MARRVLFALIGSAFAARAVALWLTRPEFTGWFNHTYYYWVQTRGVLEHGTLPYTDLPLLFHLYAAVARALGLLGLDVPSSIINASRLVMCVVPALLIFPVYFGLRRVHGSQPLTPWAWTLVGLAAFLPLTFVHMPELLQKNMLGMLLLASLMVAVFLGRSVFGAFMFVAIALTHFGTLAVSVLSMFTWIAAVVVERRNPRQALVMTAIGIGVAIGAALVLTRLDQDAVVRLATFARSGVEESLLGVLVGGGSLGERLTALAGIVVPGVVALMLLRVWSRHRTALGRPDRVFWLANILFAWALVAPVWSLEAIPRLLLFAPLPLLFVLAFQLRHGTALRLHRLLVASAAAGCALLLVGETVSLAVMGRGHAEIHTGLRELRERHALTGDDLVITEYGVNAISNWFLGTRASLITSVQLDDFARPGRIFVLVPTAGHPTSTSEAGDGDSRFVTPAERYRAMRQRVQLPASLHPLGEHDAIALYRLDGPPENWAFDEAGRWVGWRRR